MAGRTVVFYQDQITPNLLAFPARLLDALEGLMEDLAPEVEDWMKSNAPWDDKTGNARDGLSAEAFAGPTQVGLDVGHSPDIPYGIYLEYSNDGKYAIVRPTLRVQGRRVMQETNGLFDRMGR